MKKIARSLVYMALQLKDLEVKTSRKQSLGLVLEGFLLLIRHWDLRLNKKGERPKSLCHNWWMS
jgi:hypothetical protein